MSSTFTRAKFGLTLNANLKPTDSPSENAPNLLPLKRFGANHNRRRHFVSFLLPTAILPESSPFKEIVLASRQMSSRQKKDFRSRALLQSPLETRAALFFDLARSVERRRRKKRRMNNKVRAPCKSTQAKEAKG